MVFGATCMRKWFLYTLLVYIVGEIDLTLANIVEILALLSCAIGAVSFFISKLLEWSVSSNQKEKYRRKREVYYTKVLDN